MFKVYKAEFMTEKGTWREYVGYTRSLEDRVWFLENDPPAFAEPMVKGTLRVRTLEDGLPTKAAALAVEALQAARAISEKPRVARGGPWSMPSALSREALVEIRRVASCRSLLAVAAIAGESPHGALAAHLGNLRFTAPRGAVAGKPVVRGAVVTTAKKPGRAGTAGNKCRRSQVVRLQVLEASRILPLVPVSCVAGRYSNVTGRHNDGEGRRRDATGRYSDATGRYGDVKAAQRRYKPYNGLRVASIICFPTGSCNEDMQGDGQVRALAQGQKPNWGEGSGDCEAPGTQVTHRAARPLRKKCSYIYYIIYIWSVKPRGIQEGLLRTTWVGRPEPLRLSLCKRAGLVAQRVCGNRSLQAP